MNHSSISIFWLISILIEFVNLQYSGSFDSLNCPGLPDKSRNNVHLECINRSETITDCSFGMPHGSTANYSCPKYFKSMHPKSIGGVILCIRGVWKFYSEFLRFSCVPACGQWDQRESVVKIPPWHVEIYNRIHRMMGTCHGTLIPSLVGNAYTVITLRSCLSKIGGQEEVGDTNMGAIVGQSTVKYQISSVYFAGSQSEDIAILRLAQPVMELSEKVLPVCILPDVYAHSVNGILTQEKVENDQELNGLVFGMERSSKADTRINLTKLNSESCRTLGFTPKHDEFCALKAETDASVCSDIFQPFLLETELTYHIYGIPKGTLRVNSCPQHGVVYTKISAYQNWIQEILLHLSQQQFRVAKAPTSLDG